MFLYRGRASIVNKGSTDHDDFAGTSFPGCVPGTCTCLPESGTKRQSGTPGRAQSFLARAKYTGGCETELPV